MSSVDGRFTNEVLDLRVEIMNRGALALGLAISLIGMAVTSIPLPPAIVKPSEGIVLAIFGLTALCAYLSWSGLKRLALWICAWGAFALAFTLYLNDESRASSIWIVATCALVTLLLGSTAGWLGVVVVTGGLGWLAINQAGGIVETAAYQILAVVLPAAALVYLVQTVVRELFRALRWVSEGYETARRQSEELSEKGAQLSTALKSLDQTSFALARANERLEITVKHAEDAYQSKQDFAAKISHELRAPLNLIGGFSEVILSELSVHEAGELLPDLIADLHAIERNARHMLTLVNDILDLSQMDMNYLTIMEEPMSVAQLIQSAAKDVEQLIYARGLTLELSIEPDLPVIYADRTRLRQVLLNLLNNALRFTMWGGLTIKAYRQMPDARLQKLEAGGDVRYERSVSDVQSEVTDQEIVIGVTDTGVGISAADTQRIFEPFVQLSGPGYVKGDGSGLGLTISKRFVELHGGRMWVESEVGRGSTFFFSLPVHPPSPSLRTQGTSRAIHRREVGALAVVESTPCLSRLLERYLRGISVVQVPTVEEMITRALDSPIEAALINEPRDSGPQLMTWPEQLRHMPVLSCYTPLAGQVLNLPRSPHGHLAKPITRDQVYEALSEMLSSPVADSPGYPAMEENSEECEQTVARTSARILVVDDDEDTLQMMSRILRLAPPGVRGRFESVIPVRARSGEQALEFLRATGGATIAGIFLDLVLSGMSGFDALREIEADDQLRHIPVCLVSGYLVSGDPLITPYLALTRRDGLSVNELARAIAALLGVAVPGLGVRTLFDENSHG